MKLAHRPSALAAAVVLIAAAAFAGGSLSAADAGRHALSSKDVKKIAKKQVQKMAPSLTVAAAGTATNAAHANVADFAASAGSAASAAKVGTSSIKTFAVSMTIAQPAIVVGSINGLTLTASCPSAVPTLTASAGGGRLHAETVSPGGVDTFGFFSIFSAPINDTTRGQGTGSLSYTAADGSATTAFYGWQNQGSGCQIFGSMVGG